MTTIDKKTFSVDIKMMVGFAMMIISSYGYLVNMSLEAERQRNEIKTDIVIMRKDIETKASHEEMEIIKVDLKYIISKLDSLSKN